MKTILYFIYNRVYKLFETINGSKSNPQIPTWLFFAFIFQLLIVIVVELIGKTKDVFIKFDGVFFLILFILLLVVFYFLTIFRNNYLKIIGRFEKERMVFKVIGNIIIVSLAILILMFALKPFFIKLNELP